MPTISSSSGFRKTVPCGSTSSPPKTRCSFVMAFSSPLFRARRVICGNMGSRMPPGGRVMSLDRRLLMLDQFPAITIGAIGWSILALSPCPVAEHNHGSLGVGRAGRDIIGFSVIALGRIGFRCFEPDQHARAYFNRIPAWYLPPTIHDQCAMEYTKA